MPYALRTYACDGCGGEVEKRAKKNATVYCIMCAIGRSAENVYQMRNKCGVFYDRWAAGIARAAAEASALSDLGRQIDSIG